MNLPQPQLNNRAAKARLLEVPYSSDNFMDNVGTAYRIEKSGYMDVDIQDNRLDTRRDGIVLNMNDGAAYVLVQHNDITFARNLPPGQNTKGYYGIRVYEANTNNPNSQIINNTIRYRQGASTAYGGIGLVSARRHLVANNVMHMTDNASNYVGVLLNGCIEPGVICNDIYGATNGYPELGQAGVRSFLGYAPLISCNTVDRTTNGMLFSGWALNTELRGNVFNYHRYGLHLELGAQIGPQDLRGNLWMQAAPGNGWQAWHEDVVDANDNPFFVDQAIPNSDPPSRQPSFWFQPTSGPTFDCYEGIGECVGYKERCVECPNAIYEKIADGTLQNGNFTDETLWTLGGDLYNVLKEAPDLRDDPDMDAFYTEEQSAIAGQLKDLDDERVMLYAMDSVAIAQLQQNRAQLLTLWDDLLDAMAQLAALDSAAAQGTALREAIAGLQQGIGELVTYNAQVLELAVNSRVSSAEGVRSMNAAIGANELTETNYKTVNDIYLSTVAKDIDDFTATQAQDLFSVANQCPLLGGNAVFQARALYYLIDPEQGFDDPALCLQHGLITKRVEQVSRSAVSIVPNPASDEAALVLTQSLADPGSLSFYNALGAEVMRVQIPSGEHRVVLSTASLAPGIYHYRARSAIDELGEGKLSIVR